MTYLLLALSLGLAAQAAPARPAQAQNTNQAALNDELLDAARQGDVARVTRALERGADVNAGNRYKATALFFAADKGHLAVVNLLLDKGADANIVDTFYKMRAIDMALSNDHEAIALRLLERGSKGAAGVLQQGIRAGNIKLVQAALGAADLTPDEVRSALGSARRGKNAEIVAAIEKRAVSLPPDPAAVTVEPGAATAPAPAAPVPVAPRTAPKPWPAFRGANAAGNGDGQGAVTEWDAASAKNIRWKTPIPGIANASPVVWGNKIFVATAISAADDKTFRTGLYGDVKPVEDLSVHTWKMFCLDKGTGKILWERTAFTGAPKVKRHTKASHANSTPVTDGNQVVALFGSIGLLAAWDMNGKPLWTKDIGVLDSGWFFDPTYQWGHSSSPIIHDGKVIVQADLQKQSFIAAFDVKTGKELWRTERDEISSWGTPTIFSGPAGAQIVTNAPTIRGYDPATGKELWKLGPNSEGTVGTPVVGDGLIYIVYAAKPGASGDISMPKDKTSTDVVAGSNTSGTDIPTPLYYDGILYTCGNDGVVTAYDAKSGERIYRARVGGGGSFSASPVAADGKLYFANEDGDIIVARAGRKYEELAKNSMKEIIMSTPAISDGLVVVRTLGHVYGVGEK